MRVLFITPYPKEGPSSRYRVEQFIPYLESMGCRCLIRPFISSESYKVVYKKGCMCRKLYALFAGTIKRFRDFFLALRSDLIFIHLEAYPFGAPLFEWSLSIFRKKVVYDLDDAIHMKKSGKLFQILKCPWKIKRIIGLSRVVIACNEYLARYAAKFNQNVSVIHTSVDTDIFTPGKTGAEDELIIGWIGSHSTAKYLKQLNNPLKTLSKKYKLVFKVIGAGQGYTGIPEVNVKNIPWSLEDEIKQLQSFDIGVYPLPNDQWVLGKTGFKTIQYMSVGIPAVVSDVGANKSIIVNGVNGFRVDTDDQWVAAIGKLIEDPDLRRNVGTAGRKTVEERYSLKSAAPQVFDIIQKVHQAKGK